MSNQYFSMFPIIAYANNSVRNISERATILHTQLIDPNNYYPIEVNPDTRADTLADQLYSDPYLDWLIWLNNNTLDPYYQWFLNDDEFRAHIKDKYGSIPVAKQTISYYRTAWPASPSESISIDAYKYTIPGLWQKYYQPFSDYNGNILHYNRSYLDWRMNTNQMVQWDVTMTTANTVFATANVVQVIVGGNVVGQAQVVEANSSTVVAQHTSGNLASPAGLRDMFNANVAATTATTTILATNIDPTEAVFWEPVTMYDVEDELNSQNRFVSVVDPGITMQLTMAINTLLNQ